MSMRSLQRRAQDAFRRVLSRTLGVEVDSARRVNIFRTLLRRRIHRSKDFFFVQIGANDGIRADPIYQEVRRHRLRGLVVEPLADFYEALVENYSMCPDVIPVNVAIHESATEMVMHRFDPRIADAPDWCAGIGSFDPEFHVAAGVRENCMIQETVRCVSLKKLLSDHGVTRMDLLQIDTEGYDAEIIRMVDFDLMAPYLIRFEHVVSEQVMSPAVLMEIVQLLGARGYDVVIEAIDAVAFQRSE